MPWLFTRFYSNNKIKEKSIFLRVNGKNEQKSVKNERKMVKTEQKIGKTEQKPKNIYFLGITNKNP
jgi:hypothetical protein